LIKNSQPFWKKFQKTVGGIFLTHTVHTYTGLRIWYKNYELRGHFTVSVTQLQQLQYTLVFVKSSGTCLNVSAHWIRNMYFYQLRSCYTWVPKFIAVYNVKCDLVLNNI